MNVAYHIKKPKDQQDEEPYFYQGEKLRICYSQFTLVRLMIKFLSGFLNRVSFFGFQEGTSTTYMAGELPLGQVRPWTDAIFHGLIMCTNN